VWWICTYIYASKQIKILKCVAQEAGYMRRDGETEGQRDRKKQGQINKETMTERERERERERLANMLKYVKKGMRSI
jgi:hypothetical protein